MVAVACLGIIEVEELLAAETFLTKFDSSKAEVLLVAVVGALSRGDIATAIIIAIEGS